MSTNVNISVDMPSLHRAAAALFASMGVIEASTAAIAGKPISFVVAQAKLIPICEDIVKIAQACIASANNLQQAEHMVVSTVESLLAIVVPQLQPILATANAVATEVGKVAASYSPTNLSVAKRQEFATTASRTIGSMFERLSMANGSGEILVESNPKGTVVPGGVSGRHFILYLPGTQSWSPIPGKTAFDFPSDVQAYFGGASAAQTAAEHALKASGFREGSTDTVTVVGYSEGALVGKNLANSSLGHSMTALIAVAAPIDGAHIPSNVKVINLQHPNDPITKLDFTQPQHAKNWWNVPLESTGLIGHSLNSYVQSVANLPDAELAKLNGSVGAVAGRGQVLVEGFLARRG